MFVHIDPEASGPVSLTGVFLRRAGGRIAFLWGDFGSSCRASYPTGCERGVVTRSSPNVLRVTIDTQRADHGEFTLQVDTFWRDGRVRDSSAGLPLGLPPWLTHDRSSDTLVTRGGSDNGGRNS
jgi:hypothetical protein